MKEQQDIAAIRSVIYRMAERYGAGDVNGVMESFVGDGVSIIGTGADEIRFGPTEVQIQVARDISEADALSMSMDNIRVDVFGDAAFAFADSEIHARFGDQNHSFPIRATFGLVRTGDGWRIAQNHVSVAHRGQSEGRSFSAKLTKTLSDLLVSIDNAAGSSILESADLGTATILFTDIVGSTALSQSMGDHQWSRVIADHFTSVRSLVVSEGGSVVKTLGDGGMFAFRSGTAALIAATRIQQAMAENSSSQLSLRVGAHTGDVVQGGNDFIGLTVSKAARVAAAARGGEILVSATTAEVVNHSEIRLGEPKTVELRGISGSHVVYPLLWDQISA